MDNKIRVEVEVPIKYFYDVDHWLCLLVDENGETVVGGNAIDKNEATLDFIEKFKKWVENYG